MKKLFFLSFLLINQLFFAQNKEAIFGDKMVWYGVDYSKAKFIGDESNYDSFHQLKTYFIPAWNMMVVKEPNKYDLRKFFKKRDVFLDLGATMQHNQDVDSVQLFSSTPYKFDNPEETINQMISGFKKGEKTEGLGVVFVVESYNKVKEQAVYYLTFFDIATKQIILTEKMVERPMGIGLRNFWATTIIDAMKDVENKKYNAWKSKFGGKN